MYVSGKWQYEVQLGSTGIMQIGWATIDCKFSQESGVGKCYYDVLWHLLYH
jgi:Kip1 ubiquitination-promoting complex protein 1